MPSQILIRNDTAANWNSVNPILAKGEMGVEYDTGRFKIGNGTTTWQNKAYSDGSNAPQTVAWSLTVPLDGTKNSLAHTISGPETYNLGAYAEGSSYYVDVIGDGNSTHVPVFGNSIVTSSHSDTFNTARFAINTLVFAAINRASGTIINTGKFLNTAPTVQVAPSLNPAPPAGQPFGFTGGTYVGYPAPTTVGVQWYLDGVAIAGATGNTYSPANGDIGHNLSVQETVSNTSGSITGVSNNVTPVGVAAPVFVSDSAPAATVGTAYDYAFSATGATGYSVGTGSLPPGLTLNSTTGHLAGTPTTAGTATFRVDATGTGGTTTGASQSVVVSPNLSYVRFSTLGDNTTESGSGPFTYSDAYPSQGAVGCNYKFVAGQVAHMELKILATAANGGVGFILDDLDNTSTGRNQYSSPAPPIVLDGSVSDNYSKDGSTGYTGSSVAAMSVGDIMQAYSDGTTVYMNVSKDNGATYTEIGRGTPTTWPLYPKLSLGGSDASVVGSTQMLNQTGMVLV